MRASTLFALTIAILIGLGVAIWAKVSGLFNPAAEAPQKQEIKILAAAQNIFAGDTITPSWVQVRSLKAEEYEHYQKHKDQYLPPLKNAAALRISSKDILADQPLLKDHLAPMQKPKPLHTRLMPSMRAVSVSLEKEQSVGGLLQVGEWVDVLLTSTVKGPQGNETTRTATVAPTVRIIAKRGTLWPVFAPLPEDEPVQFTLEVNPYRASLIEFSRNKGTLTLTPLPQSEQEKLEVERTALMKKPDLIRQVHFEKPGTPEAKAEEKRVKLFNQGELVITEQDLVQLFGLTTAAPPEAKIEIQQMVGMNTFAPATFASDGSRILPDNNRTSPGGNQQNSLALSRNAGFQFGVPDCPTCDAALKARKKASR